jgi:hypothetical protein
MKTKLFFTILLLISVIFICSVCKAQYRINRTNYDYRTYSFQAGDKYNTVAAGVTSLFLPGLGQILSGETVRGIVFFGGYSACMIACSIGLIRVINTLGAGISGEVPREGGIALMVGGSFGVFLVDIWSVFDAVRVAKVNNLAWRDQNKASLNIQMQPWINTACYSNTGSIPAGVTLKVTF